MFKYSESSEKKLMSCHPDLRKVFRIVLDKFDHTITEGHRDEHTQNLYFKKGASKVEWPDGKHNRIPAEAVDAAPYPIEWPDKYKDPKRHVKAVARFYMFAGYVLAVADRLGVSLRWGGDWDGDKDVFDQSFDDLVHFELKEE